MILAGPNGELLISPNVEGVKGEAVVLGVPKVTAVFVCPNGALEEVTVVPKVSPAVPVAIPKVGFEKAVVLVV